MDGFDECGISYLTASSVTMYRENPACWVMRYLYGVRPKNNVALARTIAVKDALKHWLYQGKLGFAEDLLDKVFTQKCDEYGVDLDDPDARSEHSTLLELFLLSVKGFQQLGLGAEFGKLPVATDIAHSVWVEGLGAPFLAAPAFVFQDWWVEVKPGKRCYNAVTERDRVKACIHHKVYHEKEGAFIYASPKRFNIAWSPKGAAELEWAELALDALALQNFIQSAQSREHALAMVPINPGHYRWDEVMLTEVGKALAITQETMNAVNRTKAHELRAPGAGDIPWDLLSDLGSGDD